MGRTGASSGQNSMASIRCMSSSKLFIGGIFSFFFFGYLVYGPTKGLVGRLCYRSPGLSYATDEHSLKDAFSSFGEVVDAVVINDRETGRSRGFGFVSFDSEEFAQSAMSSMDGQPPNGRNTLLKELAVLLKVMAVFRKR